MSLKITIHFRYFYISSFLRCYKLFYLSQNPAIQPVSQQEESGQDGINTDAEWNHDAADALQAINPSKSDPAYNTKLLSFVSKHLEALASAQGQPDMKRLLGWFLFLV